MRVIVAHCSAPLVRLGRICLPLAPIRRRTAPFVRPGLTPPSGPLLVLPAHLVSCHYRARHAVWLVPLALSNGISLRAVLAAPAPFPPHRPQFSVSSVLQAISLTLTDRLAALHARVGVSFRTVVPRQPQNALSVVRDSSRQTMGQRCVRPARVEVLPLVQGSTRVRHVLKVLMLRIMGPVHVRFVRRVLLRPSLVLPMALYVPLAPPDSYRPSLVPQRAVLAPAATSQMSLLQPVFLVTTSPSLRPPALAAVNGAHPSFGVGQVALCANLIAAVLGLLPRTGVVLSALPGELGGESTIALSALLQRMLMGTELHVCPAPRATRPQQAAISAISVMRVKV